MYCLYWKHADEITRTSSMNEALDIILEVYVNENTGLELWWED